MGQRGKHRMMSSLWRIVLLVWLVGSNLCLHAQEVTQTGIVVDYNGEPMIGVTVQVKESKTGVITDLDGKFSLECEKGATITFSFMGYRTVEEKATGKLMRIELQEDTQTLDEVVVIGYGSMARKDLSGSTLSVDAKVLEEKNLPIDEYVLFLSLYGILGEMFNGILFSGFGIFVILLIGIFTGGKLGSFLFFMIGFIGSGFIGGSIPL